MQELKKHQSLFVLFQRLADVVILYFSIRLFAWWAKEPWSYKYVIATLIVILFFSLFGSESELYQSWRGSKILSELKNTIIATFLSFLVLLIFTEILVFPAEIEAAFIMKWFVVAVLALISWRFIMRLGLRLMRKVGFNHKRVIVIGAGDLAKRLSELAKERPEYGIDIVGFYDDHVAQGTGLGNQQTVIGKLEDAINYMEDNQGQIDEVIVTLPLSAEKSIQYCLQAAFENSVPVSIVPDLFVFDLVQSRIRDFSGLPLISLADTPFRGVGGLIKRAEDIIIGSIILAVIAIPMLFIAIAIKLSSRGPVLFKQKRYGVGGKEVTVWKFRSMKVLEDGDNVPQATRNDSRITKLGAFLRRTSLDEFPQFINVLQGTMSIVGPRPHAVAHNMEYRKLIPGYMLRHLVRPGITGWAQINGCRGETNTLEKMQKRIEHDVYYVRNWSLWLDIKIIAISMIKGFRSEQAY